MFFPGFSKEDLGLIINASGRTFESDSDVAEHYDERFASNYMAGWSNYIETKVRRFLEQMNLPLGSWLDFGCGQGSLTGLLSYIHPHSKVESADISQIAIQKASLNHPVLSFFVLDEIYSSKSMT